MAHTRGLAAIVVLGLMVTGCAGVSAPDVASVATGLPSFDPDEPLVLTAKFTGEGGGIYVVRPDGSGELRLGSDVDGVHKGAAWSPDGQSVVFIDETTEAMYIAHLDGSPTESIDACDTPGCDHPAWSPDGAQITFSRYESAANVVGPSAVGIYTVTIATGDVTEVVRLARPLVADVPRWSPDGSQLVFGVDRFDDAANETGSAIATVPVIGGDPRYLTDFEMYAYSPDWGSATNEIVFSVETRQYASDFDPAHGTWDIYTIKPDGSGLARLTSAADGERIQSPRWTPDGLGVTAYSHAVPGGILIDPATGTYEPFATGGDRSRPQVRPIAGGRT